MVAEAGDGKTGIETVRQHRPDVVIIDLAMPVMDGIEALPSLRRLVPDGKIIVLSGFGALQMSARAVAAGADGYVQKGAPLTTIIGYVNDIVSGRLKPSAPRTLSVVATRSEPASTGAGDDVLPAAAPAGLPVFGEEEPETPGFTPPANVSMWDTLRLAPYGVVELADEPLFRLVYANGAAARLLGTDRSGTPLATVAPDLASLVSYHRLDDDAMFETDVEGGRSRPRCGAPATRSWCSSTRPPRTSACCGGRSPPPRTRCAARSPSSAASPRRWRGTATCCRRSRTSG